MDSAHYAAFPSGHAMTATIVCGLLLWLLHRHGAGRALWRTALAVAALSVTGVGLTPGLARRPLADGRPRRLLIVGALVVVVAVGITARRPAHREPAPRS
ncbi:hypothetical protein GCM10023238_31650 [Streptomyces heliomycini]